MSVDSLWLKICYLCYQIHWNWRESANQDPRGQNDQLKFIANCKTVSPDNTRFKQITWNCELQVFSFLTFALPVLNSHYKVVSYFHPSVFVVLYFMTNIKVKIMKKYTSPSGVTLPLKGDILVGKSYSTSGNWDFLEYFSEFSVIPNPRIPLSVYVRQKMSHMPLCYTQAIGLWIYGVINFLFSCVLVQNTYYRDYMDMITFVFPVLFWHSYGPL